MTNFTSKCSNFSQISFKMLQITSNHHSNASKSPQNPKNHLQNPNFPSKSRGLGTFSGVFTPTVLSCVGVILFLRIGWAVGNVGLLQVLAILIIAFVGK
jgi:hypothetical protein